MYLIVEIFRFLHPLVAEYRQASLSSDMQGEEDEELGGGRIAPDPRVAIVG